MELLLEKHFRLVKEHFLFVPSLFANCIRVHNFHIAIANTHTLRPFLAIFPGKHDELYSISDTTQANSMESLCQIL